MSFETDRTIRRDRIALLRERNAALKTENDTMKQRERHLQDAKEQIFRACIQAEQQKELTLLALRRMVSSKSKSLEINSRKVSQSINSISSLTCSIFSFKDDISVQDSGLEIYEMRGLKDESRELQLEIAKLQSRLLALARRNENERASMEKKEEELQVSSNQSRILEDHSCVLPLHAHELLDRREMQEYDMEWRKKPFNDVKVKTTERIKNMEENYTKETRHNADQIKDMEESAAALEKINAQLKEELKERDLHKQTKDITCSVICDSLQETFNQDLDEYLKKNKSLEKEVAFLKAQVADKETKLSESVNLLQESTKKSTMYEENVSKLKHQLDDVKKALGVLESKLLLKDKQIETMEKRNTQTMRKMKEEYTRKERRNTVHLEEAKEAAVALEKIHAQLKEELKEKDLEYQAKDIVSSAISNSLQQCFNEDLGQYRQNNKSLEDELALVKNQVADQETKVAESVNQLKESKARCEMCMEKIWKLTLQRDEIKKVLDVLEDKLVVKDKQIESMEMKNAEKIMKEVMKNESLEQEIARLRIIQEELEEQVKEQQKFLTSKQVTLDSSSILEKACPLNLELVNTTRARIDVKDKCYLEGQEWSADHEEVIHNQNDNIYNSNDFKSKLECCMKRCEKLEELNKELEEKAEQLQLQLNSKEKKIKELDEQVAIFDEELLSKDIAIRQLLMKKSKRRGLRRLICWGS